MKRTISLVILLVVAATLAAQPVSKGDKGKPESSSKIYAVLGKNIRKGKHTKEEILSNPVINLKGVKKGEKGAQWSVNSFKVVFISNGVEEPPILCQGNTFSEKAKASLQNMSPGTVVYFMEIRASSEKGTRLLDEFYFRIK